MTVDDLTALCREWQETLRLQDWHVIVRERRHFDMPETGKDGHCQITDTLREAVIILLSKEDLVPADRCAFPVSRAKRQEINLVHELLHLHYEPFWSDEKRVPLEQSIQSVAEALVLVKYKTQSRDCAKGE